MDRRRFVAATAAAGLAGLSGCSTAVGTVPPPRVPGALLDEGGWERVDELHETVFERSYGPVDVEAAAHTVLYEDTGLRADLVEKTLGQVDGQFGLFSATHVDFAPNLDNLPAGVGRAEILDQTESNARDQFAARMREAGLTDVERTGTDTLTVDTGEEASLTTFAATFPVPDITFDVTPETAITIDGGAVRVDGDLAVWHHGDYVLIAGGAYPGENFTRAVERDLSEAITVGVDVDLGLEPGAYREEVRALVRATE